MARSATIYTGIRCGPVHSTWCRDNATPADVFESAAATGCGLCAFVAQGWREYRAEIVAESIREGWFDPEDQPGDVSADIQQISSYREAQVDTVVTRLERADDDRQRAELDMDWTVEEDPEVIRDLCSETHCVR